VERFIQSSPGGMPLPFLRTRHDRSIADGSGWQRRARGAVSGEELCGQPAPEVCIGLRRPGSNGRDGL
jgi:hypothetical protein